MQKRNIMLRTIICIILAVTVTGCKKSADPEQFSYHGARLTELQKQSMGNDSIEMVEAIIDAVNGSQEQVDLSAYTQNNQMAIDAIRIAAYIDPIAEIAVISEDNGKPGVYKISYGCSIEEHRSMVTEFSQKIESIVKSCAGKAKTETEYAMAVFQYLVDQCQYDYDTYESAREAGITSKESALRYSRMSVYHVLMDGSGVCQQFTRAFSLLLQQADIPTVEIAAISNVPFASNNAIYNGKSEGELFGINHMWNLMQLSGKWYGADVTFAVSAKESTVNASDAVIYRYFGMSDATMQENFPSKISMTGLYQDIAIPSCGEDLLQPEMRDGNEDISTGNIALEADDMEKIPVAYELYHLIETENEEELLISFGENDAVYHLTVSLPEDYTGERMYPICYLLGNEADKESVNLTNAAIYVKISALKNEGKNSVNLEEGDFSQNPALFLNRFLYGLIDAIEKEYSVDTSDRTLCGENLGANMSLYILFHSDNLAHNVFSHYVCVNPNLYYAVGGKNIMAWESEYFQRCQELPVLLTINESDAVYPGQSSRTGHMVDVIKKREYRNMNLEYNK